MSRLSAFFSYFNVSSPDPLLASGRGGSEPQERRLSCPALVKEGTPGDLLMQDAVVPSWQAGGQTCRAGSGTLQKSLSDQIALPVISTSVPGNNVQFRGLGRSAEDTDVQAFGIPLNPPQGGGFDLSIFPQFIWSSYEFQPGPALGTFDPRGTAGSLTLVPWTEQALVAGVASGAGRSRLGSTANLFRFPRRRATASRSLSSRARAQAMPRDPAAPLAANGGSPRASSYRFICC